MIEEDNLSDTKKNLIWNSQSEQFSFWELQNGQKAGSLYRIENKIIKHIWLAGYTVKLVWSEKKQWLSTETGDGLLFGDGLTIQISCMFCQAQHSWCHKSHLVWSADVAAGQQWLPTRPSKLFQWSCWLSSNILHFFIWH